MREAARRLDAALGTREVLRSQMRGKQPILRSPPRVEWLAHRAEHLAKPGRLSRRDAERPGHLLCIQAQDLAGCCCGSEDTGRSRDMPAAVIVLGINRIA